MSYSLNLHGIATLLFFFLQSLELCYLGLKLCWSGTCRFSNSILLALPFASFLLRCHGCCPITRRRSSLSNWLPLTNRNRKYDSRNDNLVQINSVHAHSFKTTRAVPQLISWTGSNCFFRKRWKECILYNKESNNNQAKDQNVRNL